MEILIKDKTVIRILEEIGEAFHALCPHDYDRFIKYVKDESQRLLKPSGMSEEGTMINLMKIPVGYNSRGEARSLYAFIKQEMARAGVSDDFFRDRKNYQLLCRVWADAHVKKHTLPIFPRTGSATPPATEEPCPSPNPKESPSS